MAALNKHDTENGTLNKPPMFTPEDFDTWKVRMEGFIRNQDFKLWKSILEGPYIPTIAAAGAGGPAVPKDPSMYSDEDYKKMEVDSKALWLIQMSIPNSIIHAFKKCKSAQELWNSLKQMYEGSDDVKENKKDMLKQKFENFCQQNNENMSSQYLRYVQLVNDLASAGVTLDNQDVLRKFLRSLPKAWNIYSVTIRRTENLKTLTLGELFGILSAYQMELDVQESKVFHSPSGSAALHAPINNSPYFARECKAPRNQPATGERQINQQATNQTFNANIAEHHDFSDWSFQAEDASISNSALMADDSSSSNKGQQELKGNLWIVDSGCSRHMTGNKTLLHKYEPFFGGSVAFGSDPVGGYITGRGTITNGKVSFENVHFVKELNYNLLSVSQVCDQKHNMLFTEHECIVLKPGFVIPNDQILLRAPRRNNMYMLDMSTAAPLSNISCFVSKASLDESSLWHRRLCHGKQHKSSHYAKEINSITTVLHLLHMDLFGPTSVKSLGRKSYCLVVTDDFSRYTWEAKVVKELKEEANMKTIIEECVVSIVKIGVSCSMDSPAQRMDIENVVHELQDILNTLQNI
ncbi:hypothetical protein E3N88_13196 [Mikania micrantha]|uniref:Retrovirus-related Pol polyprotein from transposon TNT 1-94-like beta-barrel domain-containing protein n=1 Tax=Mikania micrantha TaxID=192012 RepID=A0A5N6PA77_9ASTR|nr:hypothetical protein E3N88_13196 [Mikania micrantha]